MCCFLVLQTVLCIAQAMHSSSLDKGSGFLFGLIFKGHLYFFHRFAPLKQKFLFVLLWVLVLGVTLSHPLLLMMANCYVGICNLSGSRVQLQTILGCFRFLNSLQKFLLPSPLPFEDVDIAEHVTRFIYILSCFPLQLKLPLAPFRSI